MKKILAAILIILLTGTNLLAAPGKEELTIQNPQLEMRDYDGIELPAGTFIPAVSAQEISTQYCPEGYKVKFIATNDLFLYDTKIIPKDTELYDSTYGGEEESAAEAPAEDNVFSETPADTSPEPDVVL